MVFAGGDGVRYPQPPVGSTDGRDPPLHSVALKHFYYEDIAQRSYE